MFSPHFSEMRPAFLKLFFQWGSFDIGLIRVGASPEFTTVTSTMSRLNFCTYLTHCANPSFFADCSVDPLLTVQVVNRQASIAVQCLKEVGWRFQVWKTQRNAYLSLGGRSSVGSRAITCLYIRHAGWQCYVIQDQVCKMQLRDLLKFKGVGKNKDKYKIDPSILNLCHLQFVLKIFHGSYLTPIGF